MSEYKPATSPKVTAVISAALIGTSLSISPESVEAVVGDKTTFSGILTETESGNPISDKTIHLYIDGVDTGKSGLTNNIGGYSIEVQWVSVGTFECETRYLGD